MKRKGVDSGWPEVSLPFQFLTKPMGKGVATDSLLVECKLSVCVPACVCVSVSSMCVLLSVCVCQCLVCSAVAGLDTYSKCVA